MRAAESAADAAALRERVARTSAWWVELAAPVTRVFFDDADFATVMRADHGLRWAGVGSSSAPVIRPTDRPGTSCAEFGVPLVTMAVERDVMASWMAVLRANGVRGRYREAGTDRWYEF